MFTKPERDEKSQHIPLPKLSNSHFKVVTWAELELCKSAADTTDTRTLSPYINDIITVKVLYQVIYPPNMRHEFRYLERPRALSQYTCPMYLIDQHNYFRCIYDAVVVVAGRVDRVECELYRLPRESPWKYIKAAIDSFAPGISMAEFLAFRHIKDESMMANSNRQEKLIRYMIADSPREIQCARTHSRTKRYLGSELDLVEFVYTRYGRDVAARLEHHPVWWKHISRSAAVEPDMLRAIAGGAQAALDIRSDYSCRELIRDILLDCEWKMEIWETWCSIEERKVMQDEWKKVDGNLWSDSNGHRILDHVRIMIEEEHTDSASILEESEHGSTFESGAIMSAKMPSQSEAVFLPPRPDSADLSKLHEIGQRVDNLCQAWQKEITHGSRLTPQTSAQRREWLKRGANKCTC